MNIAVAKGKNIKNYVDEDALTATVFGAFRYLPTLYLNEFLGEAQNILGARLKDVIIIKENVPEFIFWQNYPALEWTGPSCEPDLVLEWEDLVVVEESKWTSPKSGSGFTEEVSTDREEGDNTVIKLLVDQLARQYNVAKRLAGTQGKDFAVLYLTNHSMFPKSDINQTIDSLDPTQHELSQSKLFWINWRTAATIISKIKNNEQETIQNRLIATDLLDALNALDIELPFEGFHCYENAGLFVDHYTNYSLTLFYQSKDYGFKILREMATFLPDIIGLKGIFYEATTLYWDYLRNNTFSFSINQPSSKIFYQGD